MPTKIPYLNTSEAKGELWSVLTGCSGQGCPTKETCWARDMVKRFPEIHASQAWDPPFTFNEVQFHPDRLDQPLRWKKPRRVGVCFMSDWMDAQVKYEWIAAIYAVMLDCERVGLQHKFFTLTKQSQRLRTVMTSDRPLENLWNGVSICTQPDAARILPDLVRIPGKRWVSVEPMMSEINILGPWWDWRYQYGFYPGARCPIDWIVLGCHSNPKKHPCPPEWMIDAVKQCDAAGVPVYVKQVNINGRCSRNPEEWPVELRRQETP